MRLFLMRRVFFLLLMMLNLISFAFWNSACETMADDREIETLVGHYSAVVSVSFSPDGSTLASVAKNSGLHLWDVSNVPSLAEGQICKNEDTIYATCIPQSAVVVQELEENPVSLPAFGGSDVAYSPDGRFLVFAGQGIGGNGELHLFDMESGEIAASITGFSGPVRALAISSVLPVAAVAIGNDTSPGAVAIVDLSSSSISSTLRDHLKAVNMVTFSGDGRYLATSASDNRINIYDVKTLELVHALDTGGQPASSLAFTPNGAGLAAGGSQVGEGGVVNFYLVETGTFLFTLGGPSLPVRSLVFSKDGQTLFGGSDDNKIWVWGLGFPDPDIWLGIKDDYSLLVMETIKGHWGAVVALALSPDGSVLASGSDDGYARLWAVADLSADNCHNGKDDDGDGWVDGKDPDCRDGGAAETGFGGGSCADGADNDLNGFFDAGDPSCNNGWDDES